MLTCKLRRLPGNARTEGLQYLMQQWYRWLAYEKARYESVRYSESGYGAKVKIFTIAWGTGCSFTSTIVAQSSENAMDYFTGGYSATDNPEVILKRIGVED